MDLLQEYTHYTFSHIKWTSTSDLNCNLTLNLSQFTLMIQAHGWKFDVKIWNGNEVALWYKYVFKYNERKKVKKWKHWITNKSAGGDWVWGMRREDCLWSRWNCTGCRWTSSTSSTLSSSSTSSLYKIIEESEEKQMIFEVADAWESPTHIFHQQSLNQTQNWHFQKNHSQVLTKT